MPSNDEVIDGVLGLENCLKLIELPSSTIDPPPPPASCQNAGKPAVSSSPIVNLSSLILRLWHLGYE